MESSITEESESEKKSGDLSPQKTKELVSIQLEHIKKISSENIRRGKIIGDIQGRIEELLIFKEENKKLKNEVRQLKNQIQSKDEELTKASKRIIFKENENFQMERQFEMLVREKDESFQKVSLLNQKLKQCIYDFEKSEQTKDRLQKQLDQIRKEMGDARKIQKIKERESYKVVNDLRRMHQEVKTKNELNTKKLKEDLKKMENTLSETESKVENLTEDKKNNEMEINVLKRKLNDLNEELIQSKKINNELKDNIKIQEEEKQQILEQTRQYGEESIHFQGIIDDMEKTILALRQEIDEKDEQLEKQQKLSLATTNKAYKELEKAKKQKNEYENDLNQIKEKVGELFKSQEMIIQEENENDEDIAKIIEQGHEKVLKELEKYRKSLEEKNDEIRELYMTVNRSSESLKIKSKENKELINTINETNKVLEQQKIFIEKIHKDKEDCIYKNQRLVEKIQEERTFIKVLLNEMKLSVSFDEPSEIIEDSEEENEGNNNEGNRLMISEKTTNNTKPGLTKWEEIRNETSQIMFKLISSYGKLKKEFNDLLKRNKKFEKEKEIVGMQLKKNKKKMEDLKKEADKNLHNYDLLKRSSISKEHLDSKVLDLEKKRSELVKENVNLKLRCQEIDLILQKTKSNNENMMNDFGSEKKKLLERIRKMEKQIHEENLEKQKLSLDSIPKEKYYKKENEIMKLKGEVSSMREKLKDMKIELKEKDEELSKVLSSEESTKQLLNSSTFQLQTIEKNLEKTKTANEELSKRLIEASEEINIAEESKNKYKTMLEELNSKYINADSNIIRAELTKDLDSSDVISDISRSDEDLIQKRKKDIDDLEKSIEEELSFGARIPSSSKKPEYSLFSPKIRSVLKQRRLKKKELNKLSEPISSELDSSYKLVNRLSKVNKKHSNVIENVNGDIVDVRHKMNQIGNQFSRSLNNEKKRWY